MLTPDHPNSRASKKQSAAENAHENKRQIDNSKPVLPLQLHQIKGLSIRILEEELKKFLASLDCDLLIAASNMHHQTEQDSFYFAMRTLHDHQTEIAKSSDHSLMPGFLLLVNDQDEPSLPSFQELSILKNEDTDELIALQTIAKKHATLQKQLLAKLCANMQALSSSELTLATMPISPIAILTVLSKALAPLHIDIHVKLFIFNQFDNALQKILSNLYSALDQYLEDNGLASNPKSLCNLAKNTKQKKPKKEDTSGYLLGGNHLIREFANIPSATEMVSNNSSTKTKAAIVDETFTAKDKNIWKDNYPEEQPKTDPKDTTAQLLEPLLDHLKSLYVASGKPKNQPITETFFKENLDNADVAVLIRELTQKFQQTQASHYCSQSQTLLNELMAASFAEESLAIPVKTLLGRLEILLADAVEKNPKIILNEHHSARQLLNALVRSGSMWHKNEAREIPLDPLYQKMSQIVDKAVEEAPFNDAIFGDLLEEFEQFTTREHNRIELIEKRLMAIEEGRIKSQNAHAAVTEAVERISGHRYCCDAIKQLIDLGWHQILFVKYLKYGNDSLEYITALHILRDTLNATLVKPSDMLWRHLHTELKNELNQMGMDTFDADNLLKKLSEAINNAKERSSLTINIASPKTVTAIKLGLSKNTATEDKYTSEQSDSIPFTGAIGTTAEFAAELTDNAKNDDPYFTLAKGVKRGALFDYTNDNKVTTRCRLVALIEGVGVYIFGNRKGQKIMEKNLVEIAGLLKTGNLQVIDNSHLFDNALEKVISGLRKDHN